MNSRTPWKSPSDYHVVILGVMAGLAFGLSFGDGGSNHPTYLPPGMRIVDPSLLAHDWWATHVTHYHWVFNHLVAGLYAVGILPWSMAIGNVVSIAAFLWIMWRLARRIADEDATIGLAAWALATYFILVTDGVSSVGDSFFFSASLQPLTIATVATLAALYWFTEKRFLAAGIALAVGGAFHVNFLILNILFFGLAHLIWAVLEHANLRKFGAFIREAVTLHGLSLVLVAIFLPLILGVAIGNVTKEQDDFAGFIVHEFALPFHYNAYSYLPTFWSLAGWQLLGLSWTSIAIPDAATRKVWWAIQLSLILILWSAAFLVTVVYVAPVVKLFVWRLAPFSELVAVLLFAIGVLRVVQAERPRLSWLVVGASVVAVAAIARTLQYKFGITSVRGASVLVLPIGLLLAVSVKLASERWDFSKRWSLRPETTTLVLAYVICTVGVAALFDVTRFNLVATTPAQAGEDALYDWARTTNGDAQFVIPPNLQGFRLFANRAIVVDLKTVPYETANVLEWYRRLEAISGTSNPRDMADVLDGYSRLDEKRLAVLHEKYGVDYAVVRAHAANLGGGWTEVFRNRSFVAFHFAGASSSVRAGRSNSE